MNTAAGGPKAVAWFRATTSWARNPRNTRNTFPTINRC